MPPCVRCPSSLPPPRERRAAPAPILLLRVCAMLLRRSQHEDCAGPRLPERLTTTTTSEWVIWFKAPATLLVEIWVINYRNASDSCTCTLINIRHPCPTGCPLPLRMKRTGRRPRSGSPLASPSWKWPTATTLTWNVGRVVGLILMGNLVGLIRVIAHCYCVCVCLVHPCLRFCRLHCQTYGPIAFLHRCLRGLLGVLHVPRDCGGSGSV